MSYSRGFGSAPGMFARMSVPVVQARPAAQPVRYASMSVPVAQPRPAPQSTHYTRASASAERPHPTASPYAHREVSQTVAPAPYISAGISRAAGVNYRTAAPVLQFTRPPMPWDLRPSLYALPGTLTQSMPAPQGPPAHGRRRTRHRR